MRIRNLMDNRSGEFAVGIENLIDHFFCDESPAAQPARWVPRTNIGESATEYVLTVELPGVETEDVSVEMHEGALTIAGEKKLPETVEGFEVVKAERRSGEFTRSFSFPVSIDADDINADFKNGLLVVSIPKSAKDMPRKIEIGMSE